MIRVYKHCVVPKSLAENSSIGEDVIRQLRDDQYGKCYLCERALITDFEVEHHHSRANHSELAFEWSNLLWSCTYCNGKKSSLFDNILNPVNENIEEIIHQSFDFPNAKVLFSSKYISSESVDETIELLNRIFNGSKRIRTEREQRFYNYAMSKITSFQEMVISWLENKNEENTKAIIEELDARAEFLGFKYWIIKSNEALLNKFGHYIKWNKD